MMEISSIKDEYEVMPVNAIIEDNTIVPGLKGRKIDLDKSYDEMRVGGVFREDALVYKDIYPSNTLSNNKDKYIIKGNNNKNKVALLYILNSNEFEALINLDNITLFISHNYLISIINVFLSFIDFNRVFLLI